MANWDLVVVYDEEAASWLAEQGFAHSAVATGNRMPTLGEIRRVMHDDLRIGVDDGDDDTIVESFTIRGDYDVMFHALHTLARSCGQLWLYPDTGAPAIVIEPGMDLERAVRVFRESHERCSASPDDDSWKWLHDQLYAV